MYVAQLFKHIMHCGDLDDLRGIVMMHRLIYFISVTNVSRFSLRSIPLDFFLLACFVLFGIWSFSMATTSRHGAGSWVLLQQEGEDVCYW